MSKKPLLQTKHFILKYSKREKSCRIPSHCSIALATGEWLGEFCMAVSHLLPIFCTHWSAAGVWKKSLQIPVLARGCTHLVLDLSAKVVISNTESWGWMSPCISYFSSELWSSVQKGLHPCKYRFPVLLTISITITVLAFCFRHKALQGAADSKDAVIFNSKV